MKRDQVMSGRQQTFSVVPIKHLLAIWLVFFTGSGFSFHLYASHTNPTPPTLPTTQKYILERNVDFEQLLGVLKSNDDGVIANTFGTGGVVTVSVYTKDENDENKKKTLIYEVLSDHSSTLPVAISHLREIKFLDVLSVTDAGEEPMRYFNAVRVDTSKMLQMTQSIGVPSTVSQWVSESPYCASRVHRGLSLIKYYLDSVLSTASGSSSAGWSQPFTCQSIDVYNRLPVTVEIDVVNANFVSAQIPGIGLITAAEAGAIDTVANIYVDDVLLRNISSKYSSSEDKNLGSVSIGGNLEVEIGGAEVTSTPSVTGVPDLNILRFAGEAFYYVTPSVTPGEFTPFVGFDSQVHGTALRSYPDYDFNSRIPEWTQKSDGTYSWVFPLKLVMDPDVSAYNTPHLWCKEKYRAPSARTIGTPCTHPGLSGGTQRNNQREGLNMELLHSWNNWTTTSGYRGVYSGADYVTGLDPDELVTFRTETGADVALFKLPNGYEPWKDVPSVEGTLALNDVITAYQKNRESIVNNNYNYSASFNGFELQDEGTSPDFPTGTGGYVPMPGIITIQAGGETLDLKLNTTPPLTDHSLGFYGAITGPNWPSVGEQNVLYKLHGVDENSINDYVFELAYENHLGKVTRQTHFLSTDEEGKLEVQGTGTWTETFDMKGWGYYTLTAYIQPGDESTRVAIAGKELLDIGVRFLGEQNILSEGRGDGAYIYLDDYFDEPRGDTFSKFNRHVSKYVREYVFEQGASTRFVAFDSDPHTFKSPGVDFYLPERTLAKRISDSELAGNLKFIISHFNPNGSASTADVEYSSGKEFSHVWNTLGEHEIKVIYRDASEMYYRVKVVPPGEKANIAIRDLTPQEKSWLGVYSNGYKIAEVTDVLSKFSYKDGLRADPPKTSNNGVVNNQTNRFEPSNNYSGSYRWYLNNSSLPSQSFVNNSIAAYVNEWYPKDWIRHFSETPLPADVTGTIVSSLTNSVVSSHLASLFNKTPRQPDGAFSSGPVANESWQLRIPWISLTDQKGPRTRTNIKVIYDMKKFFSSSNGAFSGAATLPEKEVLLKIMTDAQKDKKRFYEQLNSNVLFVIPAATTGTISAKNANNFTNTQILVASKVL